MLLEIFSNISLIKTIATSKQCDIICLSKTFLHSLVGGTDNRLKIRGNNLIRAGFLENDIRVQFCMYYKDHLRDDLIPLQQCLIEEIKSRMKSCFVHDFISLLVRSSHRRCSVRIKKRIYRTHLDGRFFQKRVERKLT